MVNEKSKPTRRELKSTRRALKIKLKQISVDETKRYCHRNPDSFTADSLKPLTQSLISEGQQTPLTVVAAGTTIDGTQQFLPVGGHRRIYSLHEAIKDKTDPEHINEDMLIDVQELVRGENQSERDFENDVYICSVSENEQRRNFNQEEKLQIVKEFDELGISEERAASALGISVTSYKRFAAITSNPVIHKAVVAKRIGLTDAATVIQSAAKNKATDRFMEFWGTICPASTDSIEQQQQTGAKNTNKAPKQTIAPRLVRHWVKQMENEEPFDSNVELSLGISLDSQRKTLAVRGGQIKIDELSAAEIQDLIGELQDLSVQIVPLVHQQRAIEAAGGITDEEAEQEILNIRASRRSANQKQAELNKGRPVDRTDEEFTQPLQDVDTDDDFEPESYSSHDSADNGGGEN
jgi:hypothetical protein